MPTIRDRSSVEGKILFVIEAFQKTGFNVFGAVSEHVLAQKEVLGRRKPKTVNKGWNLQVAIEIPDSEDLKGPTYVRAIVLAKQLKSEENEPHIFIKSAYFGTNPRTILCAKSGVIGKVVEIGRCQA